MDYKICFGIPSYLPDSNRQKRLEQVKNTLQNISKNINIPIIIIAQNWKNDIKIQDNWFVYDYDKLGITTARIELRKKFLESNFDYMIMLDDDIKFNVYNKEMFLSSILNHTDGWSTLGPNIQFLIISKNVYKNVEFPNVDVNRDKIFEDAVFLAMLRESYREKEYNLENCGVEYDCYKNSTSATLDTSTWWSGDMKLLEQCRKNTLEYIKNNVNKKKNKSKTYIGSDYINL